MSISPAVITSRTAQKNHDNIVAQHADIIQGMSAQAMKVQAYNANRDAQRATEMQNKQTMDMEIQKNAQVATTASQKMGLDYATKMAQINSKSAEASTT